ESPLERKPQLKLSAAEPAFSGVERVRALHLVDHGGLQIAGAAGGQQLRSDAEDLRDGSVRLLSSLPRRVGELDQARLQQHPNMEVEVARIDAEPLCQLPVRQLPVGLFLAAEHLEHPHPKRMSERLELLGLVDDQRLAHPAPWALLHIELLLSSLDRGCGSAIEDCSGATRVR